LSADSDSPAVDETVEEAVADEPTQGKLTSEMSDQEIWDAIEAEKAARAASYPPAPRQVSLQDLYFQITALVKAEARLPRAGKLSEQSAVKLLEMALMWALNTRNAPAPVLNDIPTEEIGGSGEEGPTPDEAIGFDEETDEETAA
jgi:hypothetical protein